MAAPGCRAALSAEARQFRQCLGGPGDATAALHTADRKPGFRDRHAKPPAISGYEARAYSSAASKVTFCDDDTQILPVCAGIGGGCHGKSGVFTSIFWHEPCIPTHGMRGQGCLPGTVVVPFSIFKEKKP